MDYAGTPMAYAGDPGIGSKADGCPDSRCDSRADSRRSECIDFRNNPNDELLLVIDDIKVPSIPPGVLFGDSFE